MVPEHLQGRIFAVSDTFVSWAFGISFLCAGPMLSGIGIRETLLIAGGAGLLVAAFATRGAARPVERRCGAGPRAEACGREA